MAFLVMYLPMVLTKQAVETVLHSTLGVNRRGRIVGGRKTLQVIICKTNRQFISFSTLGAAHCFNNRGCYVIKMVSSSRAGRKRCVRNCGVRNKVRGLTRVVASMTTGSVIITTSITSSEVTSLVRVTRGSYVGVFGFGRVVARLCIPISGRWFDRRHGKERRGR